MPPIKNARLGKYLRKAREAKGLSLRELGQASGLDYSFIARLEKGEFASPGPEKLQKLSRALEIDIEDIYALAGYTVPEGLPAFAPYLRAKYDLPETAVGEIERYFGRLQRRYEKSPPSKKRGGSRGKSPR